MRNKLCRILGVLMLLLMISSCATRVFCSSTAPKLPVPIARSFQTANVEERVTAYTKPYHSPTGFQIHRVVSVKVQPSCGMDLMASFYTLGLIPYSAPHPVHVRVEGDLHGTSKTETYSIGLDRTTSIWHRLVPASHDDRAISRATLQAIDLDRVAPYGIGGASESTTYRP